MPEPRRESRTQDQGIRHRRRTRPRRHRHRRDRHRGAVLRPHAHLAGQPRQLRSDRAGQGRRRDRGAPHRRGHRDRAGPGAARRRSATRRASAGSATRSSRWTRRSHMPLSTCPAAPTACTPANRNTCCTPRLPAVEAPYHTVINRHVFESLAMNARIALHVRTLYGRDPHHITEAQYKAVARALRQAVEYDPRVTGVPSTKGTCDNEIGRRAGLRLGQPALGAARAGARRRGRRGDRRPGCGDGRRRPGGARGGRVRGVHERAARDRR